MRVKWHPESFYKELQQVLNTKMDESVNTINESAKSEAPVRTGELQKSIYIIVEDHDKKIIGKVGSDLPYAGIVERGHKTRNGKDVAPNPYLRRGLANVIDTIKHIFSSR